MKVIQYQTSYSSQKIKKHITYAIALIFILLFSLITFSVVEHLGKDMNIVYRYSLIVLAYIALGIFYIFTRHKYIDEFFNNLMGKKGENLIAEILKTNFDDSYTYIRNYEIPNCKIGDIDGILISSNEIIILEVKYYTGDFEILKGEFYKFSKRGKLYRTCHNPIRQAQQQKESLVSYLDTKGFNVPMRALVVLASGNIKSIQGVTYVYVLNENNLVSFIKKEIQSLEDETPPVSVDSVIDCLVNNNLK